MAVGWVDEDAWTTVSVQIRTEFRKSSDISNFLFFFLFLPFVRSVFSAPCWVAVGVLIGVLGTL